MKIGAVAKLAEVTVDAVRFYERRGVLPAPQRRASGYRMYTRATVERIRMTRSLQQLGFTLDEVVEVMRAFEEEEHATCANQAHRLEAVIARLDAKIAMLRQTRRKAVAVLKRCRTGGCSMRDDAKVGSHR